MGAGVRIFGPSDHPSSVTRAKPAGVRFYFDADIRGLGILLSTIRPDVTYPGDPAVRFTSGSGHSASWRM